MSQGLKAGTFLHNKTYRIERVLGQGGFGITYLAIDMHLDRKVAVKEFFPKDYCDRVDDTSRITLGTKNSENFVKSLKDRFIKEAKNIAKFDHSGIIRIYSAFEENNTAYYVMDYIEGESLSQRMAFTKGPFSEDVVRMELLPPILDALEYIHNLEKPIYHLDLKPANIMIDKQGRIKLIDFGASKQISHGGESSSSSGVAYTMGYAPPEQLEGDKKKFGAYTDIYSLGATIYNLLTNEKPPQISDIITDTAADNALKLPKSPIKELIMWMMKLDRDERPQSVAEVKKFLENIMAGESSEKAKGKKDENKKPADSSKETNPGNDDTEIKKKSVSSQKNNQKSKGTESDETPLKKYKYLLLSVVAIAIIITAVFLSNRGKNEPAPVDPLTDSSNIEVPEAVKMKTVENQAISVTSGPDNMRKYSYTGQLVDSLGALPNGQGIAKFEKYKDIPAATYKGNFVNGICNDDSGNATMTYDTGDKFIGKFKNGYYDYGKYILPSNEYFVGTFKDGSPYDGKWYYADDREWYDVEKGEDLVYW